MLSPKMQRIQRWEFYYILYSLYSRMLSPKIQRIQRWKFYYLLYSLYSRMLSPKMQRIQRSVRINEGQLLGLAEKARYSQPL